MEFTIYTSGNFDFMMMIFNGLAMAFDEASGDFGNANYIMGLGLVIAVFAGSIKGIMEKGQPDLSLVAKGWVLWCILFLPRTDIAIEHAGTGDVAYYTGIPAGLAMGGAVATQIPVSMVDTLANIFVMPSYSGEHIDAFKTLIKQERVIASHPKLTTLTYGAQSTDFVKSFDNYIQDCVLLDMEMGVNQDVFGAMLRTSADPWANMKVNSGSWFTQIKINSGSSDFETMTCTDAYSALDSQLGSSSSAFATVLNSINEQEGIDVSQVTNSMLQMGGGSIDAFTLQVNNFIDYRLMQISSGMSDGSKLDHYFDGIQFQAKQQRIMSMSGDANLWMEMAPVITTIIEALMWFMAPIVSFMVLLGTGHSLIVKYFRFLVVVGMFPVVSILINLYLDWSITNYIEPYAASGEIWSIGGLHNFYTTAGSYVAIAGYLTMAIPMIAYAFVTGSDYMISGLANRMGSTAHINPKAASPDVASPVSNGVYRFGNQSMTMTDNGTVHTTSALNDINAPKLNAISQTSQSVNQQLQQAKTQLSASEQSAQKSVSKMLNRVTEAMDTKGSGTDTTTNLSHNEQKLMGLAEDIQKQTGWTADKSVAAAAQLTAHVGAEGRGSVSGGILTMAMGGGIKLSGSGDVRLTDKEMEQARKAIGLKTDDKGSVSADFRKSDAYKDMQTINKRNGWTDQASRMVSNIDRYAEQQQVVDSLARSSQAMASISNPATTDFTKAAEHKEFANWVASGGNYMQLSDEEKSLRAAAIEKSAALYHNNDIGRAAAKMFVNDYKKMSDDLVGWKAPEKPGELAGSKAPADTAAVYQNLSEMLGGAGKMIGDSNLITMSENMAGIASKLQSETAPKLNRPEGVPTKQKVNQDFNAEESKTVGLVAQGDKEAKANNGQVLENKYNQNKDVVRTSGSALAAEVASMNPAVAAEVAEAKTKIPGNVDTLPPEALVLGDSAVGVLKDGLVEASNTAMKYIDTDTQKALDKGVEGASSPKFAEKGIEAVTQQSDMELVAALKDGTGVNATREQRLEALAITSVAFGDNSLVSNAVEAGRQGTHPHNAEHNAALEAKQNAVNQYLGNLKQSNPEAYRDLVTTSQLLNSGAITGKGVEAMLAPRGSLDPEQSHLAAQTAQTLMDNGVAVDKSVMENAGSQVRKLDTQGQNETTYGKTGYGAGTSGYQPDKPVQNQGRAVELGERVKAANDVVANLSQLQRPVAMDAITALKSEGGLAGYAGRQVEMFNNGNLAPAQFAQARNAINQIADNLDDKAPQFIKDDVAQAQAQVNEAAAQFMNPVPQQNTTAVSDERGDGSHVVSTKLFNAVEQTPKGEQVVLNGDGYTKLAQSDDRQQQYLRNEKTGQNYVLDNQNTFWFGVKMKPIEEDQLPSSAQNMLPSSDSTSRYHTSSSHGEGASPAMGYYQNSGRNTTDSYPVSSRGSNSVPATTDNIKASSPESSQNQAGDSSTTPVVQGRSQGYSPALEQAPNYRSGYVYQQYKPEHNPQPKDNANSHNAPVEQEPRSTNHTPPQSTNVSQPSVDPFQRMVELTRNEALSPQQPVHQAGVNSSPTPEKVTEPTSHSGTESKQASDTTPGQSGLGRNDVVAPQAPVNQGGDASSRPTEPAGNGSTEPKQVGDNVPRQAEQSRNDVSAPQSPVAQGGDASPRPAEPAGNGSAETKQSGDAFLRKAELSREEASTSQSAVSQSSNSAPKPADDAFQLMAKLSRNEESISQSATNQVSESPLRSSEAKPVHLASMASESGEQSSPQQQAGTPESEQVQLASADVAPVASSGSQPVVGGQNTSEGQPTQLASAHNDSSETPRSQQQAGTPESEQVQLASADVAPVATSGSQQMAGGQNTGEAQPAQLVSVYNDSSETPRSQQQTGTPESEQVQLASADVASVATSGSQQMAGGQQASESQPMHIADAGSQSAEPTSPQQEAGFADADQTQLASADVAPVAISTGQPVADGQQASESQPIHLADAGSQSAEPTSPQQEAGFVDADQTQLASADVALVATSTEQPVADGQHASESQPMHLADSGSQPAEPTSPRQEAGFADADQTQLASADVAPVATSTDQLMADGQQASESQPMHLAGAGSQSAEPTSPQQEAGFADADQTQLASADVAPVATSTDQLMADGQQASESQPMHLAGAGSQSAEPTSPQQEAGFADTDQTQLASADIAPMTTADDQLRPGNEQTSESEPVQLAHAGSEPGVMQNSAPDDGMADAGQQLLASADEQALQYASTTTSDSEGAKENYEEVLNPSFVGDGSQSMLDPDQGYASTMIDGQGSPLDPDGDVSIS